MQPEEKEMLKKALELSQENNRMLHSIRRNIFWGRVTRIVYWVIIIGAAVGIYYYIEPYLNSAINAYGNMKGDIRDFGNLFKLGD
jgi:uncharacterized membrane protein